MARLTGRFLGRKRSTGRLGNPRARPELGQGVTEALAIVELRIRFGKGETIHTENSYKFNTGMIDEMFKAAGFSVTKAWTDPLQKFALTLAAAR